MGGQGRGDGSFRVIWLHALGIQYFPFGRLSEIAHKNASETSVEHQPGRGNIQYEHGARAIKVVLTSMSQPLTLPSYVGTPSLRSFSAVIDATS